MRDRHPDSQFPPGFGLLFATMIIFGIAVPLIGIALGIVTLAVWLNRRGKVQARKAARARKAAAKRELSQIQAYRSL